MEQREAGGPKTFMEMILILWTIGLTLWSLYLFIASLSIHKRSTGGLSELKCSEERNYERRTR